jgi:hypothetical protein
LIHLEEEIGDGWDRDGLIFVENGTGRRSAYHPSTVLLKLRIGIIFKRIHEE